MKIVKRVEYMFNKTFRDEIVNVKHPYENRHKYCMQGYIVPVKYKYRGWVDVSFGIDGIDSPAMGREMARAKAERFYEKAIMKIHSRRTLNR